MIDRQVKETAIKPKEGVMYQELYERVLYGYTYLDADPKQFQFHSQVKNFKKKEKDKTKNKTDKKNKILAKKNGEAYEDGSSKPRV